MLFGESEFKSPKKTNLLSLRGLLLPLVLLLAIGGVIMTLGKLPWGSVGTDPAAPVEEGAQTGDSGSTEPLPTLAEPMEPQEPEPFEEKPEVLFRAASLDRTSEVPEEAIVYLFQKIRTDPEAFRAREPVLSVERNDRVWRKLIADPDMYRGRVVEIKGRVVSSEGEYPLQLQGLDFPNPSGLDRRFDSFVFDTNGRYHKVTTFKKARELRHKDAVRLRAYFCGLYTNQIVHEGKLDLGTVPFLVGEDYEPLAPAAAEAPDATIYLPLVVGLAAVAFVVVLALHVRTERTYDRRRRAAREALEARRSGGAAGSRAGEKE